MKIFHLIVFLFFIFPVSTNSHSSFDDSILGCFGSLERCGLFDLGVLMHKHNYADSATDDDCQESCIYFPFLFGGDRDCGPCLSDGNVTTGNLPTDPAPAPTSPPVPVASSKFNIDLDVVGTLKSDRDILQRAADRWRQVIVSDLVDVISGLLPLPPVAAGCKYPSIIDDLYICATVGSGEDTNDGLNGILATSTLKFVRNEFGKRLPITGELRVDDNDIANLKENGAYYKVLVHEMGHILGFGPLWETKSIIGSVANGCPYKGRKANAEFKKISGCNRIPVEANACRHWDENCLPNELMSSLIVVGDQEDPLSRITIAAFEDLGFAVNYTTADPFTESELGTCKCNQRRMSELRHGPAQHLVKTDSERSSDQKLSDEMRNYAIQHGRTILQQRKEEYNQRILFENNEKQEDSSFEYFGDEVISVVVQDYDGSIHSVIVTNNDDNRKIV